MLRGPTGTWLRAGPGAWASQVGSLRVDVHPHEDFPDRLFVTCRRLGIEAIQLVATDPEAALDEAIRYIRADIAHLARLAEQLPASEAVP
jgi:hypothetical protein